MQDEGEELCDFCKYRDECHGITCHGGEPCYPICADREYIDYIDFYELYTSVDLDEIKESLKENNKEGELNMNNKVLELWYDRETEKISKEFDEKKQLLAEENDLIKKYMKIVNDFESAMADLYLSVENQEQKFIKEVYEENIYKYNIDGDKIEVYFKNNYESERVDKLGELSKKYNDIDAMISLSQDLEYQLDVLRQYGIVDKNTKKMVD